MSVKNSMSKKSSDLRQESDFSLVMGGPLYQLYLRSHLAKPPLELLPRRIVTAIVITWVPLALLSLFIGRAVGAVEVPFVEHLAVHVRFLISLPLLIAAEVFVHKRIITSVKQFSIADLSHPKISRASTMPFLRQDVCATRWR